MIQKNLSATLATNQDQVLFQPICARGVDFYSGAIGEKASTLGVNCGISTGRNGVLVYDARGNGDGKTTNAIVGGA